MNNNGATRRVGDPLPCVPMEKSTRKDHEIKTVKPGEKIPYRVLGGVMMEDNDDFGVVVMNDGPTFISERQMRSWLAEFDAE